VNGGISHFARGPSAKCEWGEAGRCLFIALFMVNMMPWRLAGTSTLIG